MELLHLVLSANNFFFFFCLSNYIPILYYCLEVLHLLILSILVDNFRISNYQKNLDLCTAYLEKHIWRREKLSKLITSLFIL